MAEATAVVEHVTSSDGARIAYQRSGEGPSLERAREGTERVRAVLPDARVAVLRGQGHLAIVSAPELVADELSLHVTDP